MDSTVTVFRDYHQQALDAEYNNRAKTPDVEVFKTAQADASDVARRAPDLRRDVAYGPSADEMVDVFPAAGPNPGPVHVFFHGGYWKMNHKHEFGFVANPFVASGAAVVVVEYALIPTVDMAELVRQSRAAMAWVWRNAASFGGDAGRIHVSGHSAGGHLTAMMMATDWPAFAGGLPADLIKGGCAISGIYDLEPIRLTFMQETLGFTPEQVERNSPIGLTPTTPAPPAPMIVAAGGDESEEFLRQSETFTAQWAKEGVPCEMMVRPGFNHFTILGEFADPESGLTRAVRKQMGLG